MVLKLAESLAHAIIAAMLPYLVRTYKQDFGKIAITQIPKWFKPTTRAHSQDAFWNSKEECVQNKSNKMLLEAILDNDNLYWESDIIEQAPPKCKRIQAEDKSMMDSVSTMKTAISSIKTKQTMEKSNTTMAQAQCTATQGTPQDLQTVVLQMTTITQLTEQVSTLQMAHNKINVKLDCLTDIFLANTPQNKTPSPSKHKARDLKGDSGQQP